MPTPTAAASGTRGAAHVDRSAHIDPKSLTLLDEPFRITLVLGPSWPERA